MAAEDSATVVPPVPAALLALLPIAQAQLGTQLDDADTANSRALAEIGIAGVLVSILCGARLAAVTLTPWWFLPLIGLGASGILLGLVLRPVQMDAGRTPSDAYRLVAGQPEGEAYRLILAMLQEALTGNQPLLQAKFRWLRLGERTLVGTVVLGPVVLWAFSWVHFP
ncbi:MAG TPA: hypothetical protein VNF75_05735 [Candidatus Dormibacteraeota bacterium]|nr:hypothetical protein [Candidatus Dormibacteraeota bacterium]